jgi:hypothetical protein
MGHTAEVPLTETVCFYHSGKIGFSTHPSDSVNLSTNPSLKSVIFPRHGAARLALKLGLPDVAPLARVRAPHVGTCFRYLSRFCIRSSFFDCERVASASARSAARVCRGAPAILFIKPT